MRASGVFFLVFLVSFSTLSSAIRVGVNAAGTAFSDEAYVRENAPTAQKTGGSVGSQRLEADTSIVELAQENSTETYQGGIQTSPMSASASSSTAINHVMCKDFTINGAPVDPTTIFSPGDEKAVCLVTSPINGSVEFRWYYRNDMSKTWVSCYSCAATATSMGSINMGCEGHLFIAGHELYCPRAYKVDAYLNGDLSFSDFFEITNGGLESPRTCEGVNANGLPINIESRFTLGADTNVYYYLRFDENAYFNEELGCSHNFTTVWIQPDGSIYKTYSSNFTDYKDVNVTWNCWESNYATDDYMPINSSTPIGNWKVELYLDSYLNGTSTPYGPVATTPFVVANKPVTDWTFMVYLDADYNLSEGNQNDSAGIDTFLNIADVGSSSQVNVVVQMDRIAGWWSNGVWTSDVRFGNWTDCKRFYVTTNMAPTAGNAISDLGEVDMGDPSTLGDFVNWTMDSYPANHYCLVLWDHGAGFVGTCVDSTNNNDFLSMPKLSQALEGLPVIIDVIFNDACSMSMTEVAYQVKDYADIIVGPEGLGYSPGPYDLYLAALTSNPSMMPSELATEVVRDYIAWCNQLSQYIQNATMSAIDLTRIISLSATIDDFALELKDKETPYDQQICLARNETDEYPGPYEGDTGSYVDLYNFAQLINASTGQNHVDEELRNAAGQVMTAINESMIFADNVLVPNSHGLAIFFPSDGARYTSFENEYENTAFAADTAWNEFLQYHLSGCLFTIQTNPPYPNIPVTVTNESNIPVTAVSAGALNYSYVTDDYGKAQAFLPPAYYTVNVTAYVSTGPGSSSAFIQWEDNETSNSRTLLVNGTTTLTATYQPQYQLIINANLGTTIPSVGPHWINAGSTFNISTTAPPLAFSPTQEHYVMLGWNGTGNGGYSGMIDSSSITMNGPINETFNWRHEYYFTVDSLYGLLGWNETGTPSSGWMEAGTSILVSVTPPTPETDTRHVCTGWNGTGSVPASGTDTSANMSITQPSSITWNWKTQYRVYVNTNPAGLSPQPNTSSTGPWYDEDAVLTCTAQNVSGKVFDHWTVDDSNYEAGLNSINITVYGPHTAVAHYLPAAAWWNNLFAPTNMPFVLALFAVLAGSLVGGMWVRTSRNRIKKTYPQPAPATIPKVALPGRISTGCEVLDNLLYGGIPKGYSVALTAPSCDERDSLIKGFLEAGAKSGDATVHVTIDPAELASVAKEHQSNFYLFICSPRADTMIESLPNVIKLKGVENLTEISIALAKAFRALDGSQNVPRRACVEIISDVLLQHHALQTRRWLKDIIPEFRSKGFTTLAVVNLQMHAQEEVQAILDLFEGQIAISEKDTGTGPLKFIRVKKMTNQEYSDCELPLYKESLETHDKQKDSAR